MKKFLGIAGIVFGVVILVLAGVFFIGDHFMKKGHDYVEQYRGTREQRAVEQRQDKVAAAKGANLDELEIRKLRERLKKEKYGKSTAYRDLKKEIAKSERDLKTWYFADDAEDLEQVEAYVDYYQKHAQAFLKSADEEREKYKKYDAESADLTKAIKPYKIVVENLEKQRDLLSEELANLLKTFNVFKEELAGTPVFKQSLVEKKLRKTHAELEKKKKIAESLLEKIAENDREIERLTWQIRVADENATESLRREIEYRKEYKICCEAKKLTLDILGHTAAIREISEKILELETTRDDKKIDVYL